VKELRFASSLNSSLADIMGTGSFPGVKWPERGVDHHLASRLKKEYTYTSTPSLRLRGGL
jgi:hypothetical protein